MRIVGVATLRSDPDPQVPPEPNIEGDLALVIGVSLVSWWSKLLNVKMGSEARAELGALAVEGDDGTWIALSRLGFVVPVDDKSPLCSLTRR
jgi:hypothetical protein